MTDYKLHNDKECSICSIKHSEDVYYDLSELFKAFGDTNRIKILFTLFHHELSVQDIADAVGMTQSNVSHQLKTLKNARLVKFRKEGKTVYYSLDDDHVEHIFEQAYDHVYLENKHN